MGNPFGPLRQQNIFGQMQQQPEWNPYDDSGAQMNTPQAYGQGNPFEMYTPETQNINRFNELMGAYPQRRAPNTMQKIAASFMGMGRGGPQMADAYLNRGFNQDLMDWKNQIEPAYQGANLERQNNMNERQMVQQMNQFTLNDRRQDEVERNNLARNNIAQQRANVYQMKQMRPNLKFDFRGTNVLVADPTTGEVKDTGVPTTAFSEADKMMLAHQNRMEEIGATGDETRKTEGVRQAGRETIAKMPSRATIGKTSGTGRTTTESATQTRVRLYKNAQQLKNTRPDLAPYIKLGQQNNFEILQPGKGGSLLKGYKDVLTPEKHKEITEAIYGTSAPQMGRSGAPTTSNAPVGNKDPLAGIEPGRVKIREKSTGRVGQIPREQLERALSLGRYELVP